MSDQNNNNNSQGSNLAKERDIDYYSLLNLSTTATIDEIQKKFRKLSLYTHPDKTMGRESHEIFIQMQNAYGYLTNPTTRIIYDRYGLTGLKVYETYYEEFRELNEEFRCSDLEVEQKQQLQSRILKTSQNLVRQHVKNQIRQEYQKSFAIEFGINMQSFANNYQQFYYAGQLGRSLKLIRAKVLIGQCGVRIPLFNKKNHLNIHVITQNELKKGIGVCMMKLIHTYDHSYNLAFKNSISIKDHDDSFSSEVINRVWNNQILLKLRATINKKGISPSFNISSSQLAPFMFDAGYHIKSGVLSLGMTKDLQQSGFGYGCHVNIGEDSFSVSPQVMYQLAPQVTLSAAVTFDMSGQIKNSLGVSYSITSTRAASVFLNTNFQDVTDLAETCVIVVYNHDGYLFKFPIYLCNKQENTAGLLLTTGVTLVANLAAYIGFKKMKGTKNRTKQKEYDIAFARYETRYEAAGKYINESSLQLQAKYHSEQRVRGLEIVEAYYGLAQHIYQIDSGLLIFKKPQNSKEYSDCQLLPVKKQLQLQVDHSKLVIRQDFQQTRGVFNPCINNRSRPILFIRYKYRDLMKTVIYDFSRQELVVPRDIN